MVGLALLLRSIALSTLATIALGCGAKVAVDGAEAGGAPGSCGGGACQPLLLASGYGSLYWIEVGGDNVYWTGTMGLNAVDKNGGTPFSIAPTAFGVATDATSVYWTDRDNGNVWRAALDGSNPTLLASGQSSPAQITVRGGYVFWTNDTMSGGSVMQLPIDGGPPMLIASAQGAPYGIAVDETNVYWTSDLVQGAILKAPIGGGTVTTIVPMTAAPVVIRLTATDAYWTDSVSPATVNRVSLAGGPPEVLWAGSDPLGLVVDSTTIYFTDWNYQQIYKMPIGGGPATVIANSLNGAGLAQDATSIYWTADLEGKVYKLAK